MPSPPCWCPANRVAYNKAAGADSRERSLRSYVLGYYKSERQETLGSAKPVALRDFNSYSVILGVFYNAGYNKNRHPGASLLDEGSKRTTGPFFGRL